METFKKHQIQKINSENSQIFNRLRHISPILKKSELESDFQRHKRLRDLIKRRQMRPMTLSPMKNPIPSSKVFERTNSRNDPVVFGSNSMLNSFKSVSDFRNVPMELSNLFVVREFSSSQMSNCGIGVTDRDDDSNYFNTVLQEEGPVLKLQFPEECESSLDARNLEICDDMEADFTTNM